MKNIHEIIKNIRKEKKITQQEVAEKLETTQSNYATFESGKGEITISRLEKLAEIFNVSVGELLGLEGNIQTQKDEQVKELEKKMYKLEKENLELLEQYITIKKESLGYREHLLNAQRDYINEQFINGRLFLFLQYQNESLKKNIELINNFLNNLNENKEVSFAILLQGIEKIYSLMQKLVQEFENDFLRKIKEMNELKKNKKGYVLSDYQNIDFT